MKLARISTAVAGAGLLLVIAACSGAQTDSAGGELVVAGVPATVDAMSTTQRVAGMAAIQACEGLFASTSTLEVREGLVDSWTYKQSDKFYDFKLRQGVPFHDGTEMKSADVVASLKRYAGSAPGATFGELVDQITAKGDYEVQVTLKSPSGAIPALLATPDTAAYIMPASVVKDHSATDALQKLVCTGPYKMDQYVPDQSLTFSRFDEYASRTDASDGAAGAKKALVDKISFVPSNPSNVANLVRSGEVDVAPQFPLDQAPALDNNPDVRTVVTENGSYPLLQLNTRKGVFSNQKLRQAVLAAIDPAAVMAAAADQKYVSLDSSLMPPSSPWHSTAGADQYNKPDPARSKQLQQEAGYQGQEISLIYQSADAFSPVIVEQLKAAGFNVKAEVSDGAAFTSRRAIDTQWDAFVSGGTSYGDPLTVVFMNSGFPGWWNTKSKQQLITAFTKGATQKERKVEWEKLQALIYQEVPFVRFGGRAQIEAVSSRVKDYPPQLGSARGFFNVSLVGK